MECDLNGTPLFLIFIVANIAIISFIISGIFFRRAYRDWKVKNPEPQSDNIDKNHGIITCEQFGNNTIREGDEK